MTHEGRKTQVGQHQEDGVSDALARPEERQGALGCPVQPKTEQRSVDPGVMAKAQEEVRVGWGWVCKYR